MKPKIEALKPNNPKTIALEAAAIGLAAWQVRNKYFRDRDELDKKDPGDYPLVESLDEGNVYVYPSPDSAVVGVYGAVERPVEVHVKRSGEDNAEDLEIESMSTDDPALLEVLRNAMQAARDKITDLLEP